MSIHQRKSGSRSGSWFVRYRDERRKQVSREFGKGEKARQEAEMFDQQIKQKKESKKEQESPVTPFAPGQPVYADQIAVAWHQDKKAAGCGDWLENFGRILNKDILPRISMVPVDQLSQHHLVGLVHEIKKDRSPTTIDRYISYMKIMFQWAVKHGIIDRNPLVNWSKRKEIPKDLKVTREDVQRIIEEAAPHVAWAVTVAYNTGVRTGQSELLSLKWSHVDWDNSCLRVFGRKTKTWRRINLTSSFMEMLKEKQKEATCEYIVEYKGGPVKSIHNGFRRACRRAGLPDDVITYDIRHLYCSTLLSKGASIRTVSSLMGHANPTMTLTKYGHLMPGDGDRAVALLPELETVNG